MRKRFYDLKPYQARRGDTGVSRYAIGPDYIIVEFRFNEGYRYDYTTPGREKVEEMKKLAIAGEGLATYINQHIGANYAERLW